MHIILLDHRLETAQLPPSRSGPGVDHVVKTDMQEMGV